MPDALSLRVSEVLYRTRGRDWDYGFLLQPPPVLGEGWYTVHRRIFANVEPAPAPLLLRGALGVGTGTPFFATTFTDAERCDSQGRPIAHYIVWLGPRAEAAPGCDFGPAFVAALAAPLAVVFELSPQVVQRNETRSLDTLLRARFGAAIATPNLQLPCAAAAASSIRWLGTLAV